MTMISKQNMNQQDKFRSQDEPNRYHTKPLLGHIGMTYEAVL